MSDIKTCGYHPVHGAQIFDGPSLPAGWFDSPAKFPAAAVQESAAIAEAVIANEEAEQLREQIADMEEAATVGRAEIVRLNGVVEQLNGELAARDTSIEAKEFALTVAEAAVASLRTEIAELSAQLEQLTAPKEEPAKISDPDHTHGHSHAAGAHGHKHA